WLGFSQHHQDMCYTNRAYSKMCKLSSDGEALAIRKLYASQSTRFQHVILKSDAQTLLACDLDVISFHYVPRSDNRAADELAKSALLNYSTYPL
ncbi:hypothetical protein HID58_092570, partial [Brassica napus]